MTGSARLAAREPTAKIWRRAALAGLALALACGGGSEPARGAVEGATPAADAPAPAGTSRGPAPAANSGDTSAPSTPSPDCTDWSKLDPAALPPLPDTPYTALFERVWDLVRRKHYDPTLACTDWPGLRAKLGARLADAKTPEQAYELVSELLAALGQSHFALVPPEGRGPDAAAPRGSGSPDLDARWIDGAVVVTRSADPKIPPGSELVAVAGEPIAPVVDKARAARTAPANEAFRIRRAVAARLACVPGKPLRLSIRPPGHTGAPVTRAASCRAPEGEPVTLGHLQNVPTRVTHRMIPGTGVGVLGFNVWMLPMMPRIRAAMDELRRAGMRALVLDLRGNPGGVGPMSVPVGRLLLPKGGSLGKLAFRDFDQTFNVAPSPDAFAGPVAILVDEGTASTSEIFAAGMRALGRASVVGGGPSAGAALPSLIEELPGGAVLQYVVGDYHAPDGAVAEGAGITPDVRVHETRAAFAAGKDPVLDAAVAHLRAQLSSEPPPAQEGPRP